MLTGRRLRAKRALRLGLVDALTSPGGIAETAASAALKLAEGKLQRRKPRRSRINRLLETAVLRPIVFRKARAQVAAQTRGNYPAPPYIIDDGQVSEIVDILGESVDAALAEVAPAGRA